MFFPPSGRRRKKAAEGGTRRYADDHFRAFCAFPWPILSVFFAASPPPSGSKRCSLFAILHSPSSILALPAPPRPATKRRAMAGKGGQRRTPFPAQPSASPQKILFPEGGQMRANAGRRAFWGVLPFLPPFRNPQSVGFPGHLALVIFVGGSAVKECFSAKRQQAVQSGTKRDKAVRRRPFWCFFGHFRGQPLSTFSAAPPPECGQTRTNADRRFFFGLRNWDFLGHWVLGHWSFARPSFAFFARHPPAQSNIYP